jgi:putative transposase
MTGQPTDLALRRFGLLRPHFEDGVPLTAVAQNSGTPIGTLRRWLRAYREKGMVGLERKPRSDADRRRGIEEHHVALIEGLALSVPRPSVANIHRKVRALIVEKGGKPPSYSTVRDIVSAIDPGMALLAHEGAKVYAQAFDLLHRREADGPNAIWQADHTQLDILVLGKDGAPVRPWLTVVIDDYSRAIAALRLFTQAPSALQTALALRDAIWHKNDPGWSICGIPTVLYTDHGSDFTSRHIEWVCADLKTRLVFSQPGQPRGRGRVERVFSTINQRVISNLPGYMTRGQPHPVPSLSMDTLEDALRAFILGEYHHAPHSGTGIAPQVRWLQNGFLPRLPGGLEALDHLLLQVARPRQVHRDGVRLNGLRYIDSALAAYVGEPVLVRYDPTDMSEVRIFHQDRFLCRAICPDLSTETVSLDDILKARRDRRQSLRQDIKTRHSMVDAVLGVRVARPLSPVDTLPDDLRPTHGLRKYIHE